MCWWCLWEASTNIHDKQTEGGDQPGLARSFHLCETQKPPSPSPTTQARRHTPPPPPQLPRRRAPAGALPLLPLADVVRTPRSASRLAPVERVSGRRPGGRGSCWRARENGGCHCRCLRARCRSVNPDLVCPTGSRRRRPRSFVQQPGPTAPPDNRTVRLLRPTTPSLSPPGPPSSPSPLPFPFGFLPITTTEPLSGQP